MKSWGILSALFNFINYQLFVKQWATVTGSIDDDETSVDVGKRVYAQPFRLETFSFQLWPIMKSKKRQTLYGIRGSERKGRERDENQSKWVRKWESNKENISKIIWPCILVNCDWHWVTVYHICFCAFWMNILYARITGINVFNQTRNSDLFVLCIFRSGKYSPFVDQIWWKYSYTITLKITYWMERCTEWLAQRADRKCL